MVDTFKASYKCRLCGTIYERYIMCGSREVKRSTLCAAGLCSRSKNIFTPTATDIHNCEDGSFGISDFVGWKHE